MGRAPEGTEPHTTERSLGIRLEPGSETPLYQQLFDQIVERARTGAFPGGFRLPPTRTLAAELGTHRNTIVRAYAELELAGFVSSTVGRGTYVKPAIAQTTASTAGAGAAAGESTRGETASAFPWASLVAERAKSEPLERFRRIGRQVARGEFVNLTRMQPSPDLVPDDLFRRCLDHVMKTHGARAMGYAPDEGVPRLRERIAEDLVRQGVPARAEDVLVTTGSQQALDVVARALVDPGDTILAQEMTYPGALRIFAAAGARVESVPADRDGPLLAGVGQRRAKGFYVQTNHCNPTGTCVGAERRRELVRFSREQGIPLIEDDYAADLELDGVPPPPALRALDGEVIYVGTFSKKLIPALRVGFLLCPPSLREHLVALKHTTDLGTSTLLQHALAEFLERGYLVPHLGRARATYKARRDALVATLDKHLPKAVAYDVPSRGVTLWLRLPRELGPEAVFEEARRRGVLVSPGVLYGVDGTSTGVRLTFCFEDEARVVDGGKRLAQAVETLLTKKRSKPTTESVSVGML